MSAAFRHWSQAVLKNGSWIPEAFKIKKSSEASESSQSAASDDVEVESATEEEPADPDLPEVQLLIAESKKLRWQSDFMASLEIEFRDPDSFMDCLSSGLPSDASKPLRVAASSEPPPISDASVVQASQLQSVVQVASQPPSGAQASQLQSVVQASQPPSMAQALQLQSMVQASQPPSVAQASQLQSVPQGRSGPQGPL